MNKKKTKKIIFRGILTKVMIVLLTTCFWYSLKLDIYLGIQNSFVWKLEFDGSQVIYSGWNYYTELSWIQLYIWANTGNVSYNLTWDFVPSLITWNVVWNYTNVKTINFWTQTGTKYIYIKFYRNRNTWEYIEESSLIKIPVIYYLKNVDNNTWNNNSNWNWNISQGWWINVLDRLYDKCPNWDSSPSYYDGRCGDEQYHNITYTNSSNTSNFTYKQELQNAYDYAYKVWLLSESNIYKARLNDRIKRKELAQMVSVFVTKIMWKTPNYTKKCIFNDISKESLELQNYMRLSCELNIMWIKADEKPLLSFFPNMYVDRAQFWTIISRLLFGWKYNQSWPWRYKNHLSALNKNWIIKNISTPDLKELRWFVAIMLKRVDDKFYLDDYLNTIIPVK